MDTTPSKDFRTDLDSIRSEIAALTQNVRKLAGEASKAQASMVKTVTKAARASAGIGAKMWDEAVEIGHDTTESMTDATYAGVSQLKKQIKQNPMNSALLALGIGFAVALIGLNSRR